MANITRLAWPAINLPVSPPDWDLRHCQGGYQGFVGGDDQGLSPAGW